MRRASLVFPRNKRSEGAVNGTMTINTDLLIHRKCPEGSATLRLVALLPLQQLDQVVYRYWKLQHIFSG
jgi:hypothetical protein